MRSDMRPVGYQPGEKQRKANHVAEWAGDRLITI